MNEKVIKFFKTAFADFEGCSLTESELNKVAFVERVYPTLCEGDVDVFLAANWQALGFSAKYAAENFVCSEVYEERCCIENQFETSAPESLVGAEYNKALENVLNARIYSRYAA